MYELQVSMDDFDSLELDDKLELSDGTMVVVTDEDDEAYYGEDEEGNEYMIVPEYEEDDEEEGKLGECSTKKKKKMREPMKEEDEAEVIELSVGQENFDQIEVGDELELTDGLLITVTAVNDDVIFATDEYDNEFQIVP